MNRCRMVRDSCNSIFVLLSLVFFAINVITLNNLSPWIDEVMMLDTSYNAAVHGSWETTAWYRVAGEYPFSTYPPLYQMVATVWIWLFGSSLVTVRSMNLLFVFLLGSICLRLMKCHGLQLTPWTTALFSVLLWGTSEMAWMYRNGRPDMLCALTFALTILAIDRYLLAKSSTTRIAVIIASALLLCSGMQAAAYLCAIWLFIFITAKAQRKECGRLLMPLLIGISLGMLLASLFMLAHGRFVAFVSSIIQYSATLSSIALVVLPWADGLFGFHSMPYTQKLLELRTESDITDRLNSIAEHQSFIILAIVALAAYAFCFRNRLKELMTDKGFLMLLCALYIPLIMTIVGRYPTYYRWMAFLPLLVSVTSIADRHKFSCVVLGVVTLLLTVFGIRSMLPNNQWDYENMRSFVGRQHFKSSEAVVCPFSVFYEMKSVCETCYFIGIFPPKYMGHVDYVIEAPEGDEFDQRITNYVNNLKKDSNVVLTSIDHCRHPSLTLYQVQTKHE